MVTINDIAKALGVAKSTVSNALTNNRYVNPELKKKILDKCKELNFQPNFYATSLSKQTPTNIIGVFLELSIKPIYQNFYHELIQSIIETISEKDMHALIYYGVDTEKVKNLLGVGRSPIDGAIILSPEIEDERYLKMEENHIPFVHIGKPSKDASKLSYVDFDVYDLMNRILKDLFKLGHRDILLINSKKDLMISKERVDAFVKVYKENGFKFNKGQVAYASLSTEEEGFELMKQVNINQKYSAVVTANDLLAHGVYKYAESNQLSIGKDLSVVALGGDTYIKDALNPPLSYAHQNYIQLGRAVSNMLMEQLESQSYKPKSTIFKSDLTITQSCGVYKK